MLSPSLEDYLEEAYRFSQFSAPVRVTDISKKLNVSMPSVTKALGKLREKKYIYYQPYGEIILTEQGKRLGSFLVERNRLLQKFLNLICAKCDTAAEAEAMEHYLSGETIKAIQKLVNFYHHYPEVYQKYLDYICEPTDDQLLEF
ncbi:iron (metal) dependent repressor, DtxR family [Syntrophobotulus glycolicus DSM 8271]|uniref:Iron (Metal) dependent repressor, DtxR family n=1 Tax=Syntrophobotulus glycolicus (strain DSM 8271 / FlGlyR) TaxID=645991 RepID=F0SZ55_SYNGF|nr:metal-dependent transcriptional regulator [Syntrophobotulus glycolicus]ADY57173.1 iron (metal) dependent repressor, DtxR family [Syntrophobotulus glycolicus DSM 8271]